MKLHVVVRGETLWHIANKYDVSIDDIVKANNITNPNLIRVGQRLIIPDQGLPGLDVPSAPEPKPLPGTPFTMRTYTNLYRGRPARIFVVKFSPEDVEATVIYGRTVNGTEKVSGMAKRTHSDLVVNCSFFYGRYPLGRHIHHGKKVYDQPHTHPTVILDNWEMNTQHDGIGPLLKTGVMDCFSSYPYLIRNGQKLMSRHSAELSPPHPRTALGLSADKRQLIVIVVDGRQPGYSLGVSMTELRDLLWEEGARSWALNLDGGGSSTMWFNGKISNRPCYGERAVINALAFRAKPGKQYYQSC